MIPHHAINRSVRGTDPTFLVLINMNSHVIAKFVFFGALLVGIYYSTYSWLIQHDWPREDYSYCYMIPFVVLYLIWEKKGELAAKAALPSAQNSRMYSGGFWRNYFQRHVPKSAWG